MLNLHDSKYDVGFAEQEDKSFAPVFDEYAGYVSSHIGAGSSCPIPRDEEGKLTPEAKAQHAIGKLMQFYSKHAVINAAINQGYSVQGTTTDAEGNLQVLLNCY